MKHLTTIFKIFSEKRTNCVLLILYLSFISICQIIASSRFRGYYLLFGSCLWLAISCDGEADYIKVFRRMLEYVEEHLRFITDFRVEYTNTIAERCMRVAKARKKISGQSKNMDRGKDFANIQSIIQTANWTGQNTLELMRGIIESS